MKKRINDIVNNLRTESKLGVFFFIVFGFLHSIVMGPELLRGFFAALSLSLIIVGTLSKESYNKLKSLKKRR